MDDPLQENPEVQRTDGGMGKPLHENPVGVTSDERPSIENTTIMMSHVDRNIPTSVKDTCYVHMNHNKYDSSADSSHPSCVCGEESVNDGSEIQERYTCGGCGVSYGTICHLHKHVKTHDLTRSYYFDCETNTSYPQFELRCSSVQTDLSLFDKRDALIQTDENILDEDSSIGKEVSSGTEKPEVQTVNSTQDIVKTKTRKRKNSPAKPIKTTGRSTRSRKQPDSEIGGKKAKKLPQKKDTPLKRRTKQKPKRIEYISHGAEKDIPVEEIEETLVTTVNEPVTEPIKQGRRKKTVGKKRKQPKEKIVETKPEDKLPNVNRAVVVTVQENDSEDKEKQDVDMAVKEAADIAIDVKDEQPSSNEGAVKLADYTEMINDGIFEAPLSDGEDTETDSVQLHFVNLQEDGTELKSTTKKRAKRKDAGMKRDKSSKSKEPKEPKEKKKREKKTQEDLYASCEICNEIMLQKKIKGHMIIHTGEKTFVCEFCGQAYAKNSNLYRHKITHRDVKPFRCSFCPAQFCRKKDFTYHINSHKGYRPHVCNVCDKRFLTNKGLIQHQENIHMGITKFQCDICDRRFFKKSGLYAHRATHFDATLECKFCDRKFRDKCGLNKHVRTHTGQKHYQCHICEHAFNQCTPYYQHMEKRHDMDRGSIKDIMKIVMEAKKRDGQKVDLFRVPNNIDEIVANLKLEEDLVRNKIHIKKDDLDGNSTEVEKLVAEMQQSGNKYPLNNHRVETVMTQHHPEIIVIQPHVETMFNHPAADNGMVISVSMADNGSALNLQPLEPMKPLPLLHKTDVNLQPLEPMKPLPLLHKTEEEIKKLYGEEDMGEVITHAHPVSSSDSVLNYSLSDQTGQGTSLMSLEPMKNLLHTSGHPKQKMKLLSQYAEYQQQQQQKLVPVHLTTSAQVGHPKIPAVTVVPTYAHPGVLPSGTIDPLTDAYATSDFLERILQGH